MLNVHTSKIGNVAVVCLQGRIVRGETDNFRTAVLTQMDVSAVILDLARVSTVDAGGLGVLLELRDQIQAKGIELRLRNVTRLVRRILEITRLESVFETSPGAEAPALVLHTRPAAFLELAPCA